MPTLADIEHEISNVLSVADELPEDKEPVALEYLEELAVTEQEKADQVAYAIRKRQAEVRFLRDEEQRLRDRRQSMQNRLQAFKDYIAELFIREGITKIQSPGSTLYLRKSASANILNLDSLPTDLIKTEVSFTPKKREIVKRMKQGEEIEGAKLHEKQILCVK